MSSKPEFSAMPDLAIKPEQCRAALARILASQRFSRSGRARELLTYLVKETLEGRAEGLKAFTIAVDVFGKDQSFDADNDTLVRVQAGRLRNLLDHYFADEGRDAPVIVSLPKGAYVPQFSARVSETVASEPVALAAPPQLVTRVPKPHWLARWPAKLAAMGAVVLVAVFAHYLLRSQRLAASPRPQVIRLLIPQKGGDVQEVAVLRAVRDIAARFKEFDTVTRPEFDPATTTFWPEDYIIRAEKTRMGASAVISLVAQHARSGSVIGSVRTELTPTSTLADLLPIERALTKLFQHYGPIYSDYSRRGTYSPVMKCLLLKDGYQAEQTSDRHAEARKCAEELLAQGVEEAHLYLSLAYLHREEFTDQRNPRAGDALQRAVSASVKALEMEPSNAEGHERLMSLYVLTGDFDSMLAEGRRAIEMNPADANILASFASRLNFRGQHEEALRLLERAEQLQPVAPRWRAYAFFLAHYGLNQMRQAVERATTLVGSKNPNYLAARAIVAHYRGDAAERAQTLLDLAQNERGYLRNPRAMFERRHYVSNLVDRLEKDLAATGLVSALEQ